MRFPIFFFGVLDEIIKTLFAWSLIYAYICSIMIQNNLMYAIVSFF